MVKDFNVIKERTDRHQAHFTKKFAAVSECMKNHDDIHDLYSLNNYMESEYPDIRGWDETGNEWEDSKTYESILREVGYYREHGVAQRIVMSADPL